MDHQIRVYKLLGTHLQLVVRVSEFHFISSAFQVAEHLMPIGHQENTNSLTALIWSYQCLVPYTGLRMCLTMVLHKFIIRH